LLKAYAGLPKAAKERSALVMAGGKGWGGNLSKIIGQLELGSHVHMMGYVEETVLDVLYTRAMFLAMPSLYEGFGLPIVEAQAYGLPVLAGNNSSMPEVTGDAGILVDATNVCSIQHGLEKMIMDDEFRIDLASRARTNAARFDWDSSARQLMDVMEIAIQIRQGVVS
jgi:glycosyltransferase involved in cell wall biosynthesis